MWPRQARSALICRPLYLARPLTRTECLTHKETIMNAKRNRRRGSTILLLATILPLVLIPIVGLAIDGTVLFIVQAKLASAADGAALGAGRVLGTNANTVEIAG